MGSVGHDGGVGREGAGRLGAHHLHQRHRRSVPRTGEAPTTPFLESSTDNLHPEKHIDKAPLFWLAPLLTVWHWITPS
jgi:hypothetical protein